MGARCAIQGREREISTDPSALDDGAISLAELHSKCRTRLQATAPEDLSVDVVAGGNAATPVDASEQGPTYQPREEDLAFAVAWEAPEDDPFGYAALGFDDDEARATPRAEMGAGLAGGANNGVEALAIEQRKAHGASFAHGAPFARPAPCSPHCVVQPLRAACSRAAGSGLIGRCRGEATGAYPARIARLRDKKHPTTGEPI